MTGAVADASLVAPDALSTWHIVARAVESDGITYLPVLDSDGPILIVEHAP